VNQTIVLTIAIAFALASYVPLFSSAASSTLVRRLGDSEAKTRVVLANGAIAQLKDLRVRLDDFFNEYDKGEDQFLLRARPRDLQGPVAEYLRLIALNDHLVVALGRVRRLSRIAFWFLIAFAVLMSAAVILGALALIVGLTLSVAALALGGVVFLAGGGIYIAILILARQVDTAHTAANDLTKDDDFTAELSE
jgi:hypothetical protein